MSIPEKLGRYEIISELGKGAMGIVYRARDPLIGRELALKTFRLGYSAGDAELEQFRERFLREAQSAGILSHRNIVTIHDVAVDPDGDFFIAMEFVKGTDLKLVMQRQGRFEPSFAVEVVAQIAEGLGYAHSKGVVHRDIKPANIMITADKEAKITDFGIARVEASNLTVEGQLLGTPNYMAPEQIQGKPVDHRADIFSLGVMFYELLTGKKPFAAPNLSAVTHKIVFEPFPPVETVVPGLPPAITQVLDLALAKDPAERYDRGGDMAADLRAIYAPAASPSATAVTPTSRTGSFLDSAPAPQAATGEVPAAAAPPSAGAFPTGASPALDVPAAGVPAAGVPAAGVPVPADGGTVVTGASTAAPPTAGVPAAGVPVPADGGTVMTGASAATPVPSPQPISNATSAPTATLPGPTAPAPTAPVAAPVLPEAAVTDGGMPIAGRIAAAVGLVAALAVVGVGIFKLASGDAEVPRAADPELERQQQILPLVEEGQELLTAGQPAAALEVFDRALLLAPEDREVRRLRDQAESRILEQDGGDPFAYAAQRLEAARKALRERDYPAAIRLAEEVLEVDPEHQEGKDLLEQARGGQRRRQEIRARLRNPAQSSPAPGPTAPRPAARQVPPPAAAPPPAAKATLVIDFHSAVSEGRLTIFTGQEKIYQEPFKFLTAKTSVFSRQRAASGSLRQSLSLPSGDLDLKIYVWRKDAQTRTAEVAGNLPPGSTRTLKIELSDEGRVKAALE